MTNLPKSADGLDRCQNVRQPSPRCNLVQYFADGALILIKRRYALPDKTTAPRAASRRYDGMQKLKPSWVPDADAACAFGPSIGVTL
jgi:hypothetical protein